ncbi:MAG: glycosyltransferase family 9 protein, partial [Planctomycetota bacterium]
MPEAPTRPPAPGRILIVRLSHLGDVVHALPLFHALREQFPTAALGWAVQPEFADLLRGLPGLERRFEFDRRGGLGAWRRLRRELRRWNPDLAVDVQGNAKSGAVLWASGAPRRVGLARREWREWIGSLGANAHAPPSEATHAVDRARHLAAWLTEANRAPCFQVGLSDDEYRAGERCLEAALGSAERPVLVQLGRLDDPRAAGLEQALAQVDALVDSGRAVLVLAGPAEAGVARDFARSRPPRAGVLGHRLEPLGARATVALMAAAAKRNGCFVGGDSGPLHLAIAAGLPVVALAGPQDPARTGPWPAPPAPSPHQVLRADDSPDCAPCFARRCRHAEGAVC